ncbi:MAG: GAF domain-containing protein [Bacteroidota bacterium]
MLNQLSESHANKLDKLLKEAILADGAEMGNIQIYFRSSKILKIIAQVGFKKDFLDYFETVNAFDNSACGRAIAVGNPVMINDVHSDRGYASLRKIAKSANYAAVKSIPIINADKEFLGIISTHFVKAQSSWDLGKLSKIIEKLKPLLKEIQAELPAKAT